MYYSKDIKRNAHCAGSFFTARMHIVFQQSNLSVGGM